MNLTTAVAELKGVGPVLAQKYTKLGISRLNDLLEYYPRRYEDYSVITSTNSLRPGPVTIKARVVSASGRYVRRGMHITEAIASDEHGSVRLVWFNQPYREKALKKQQIYFISGNYELGRGRFSIMNPSVELATDMPANVARILPVYRETKGLDSRQIRKDLLQVKDMICSIEEPLPKWVLSQYALLPLKQALLQIHFPETTRQLEEARLRLSFDEVFRLSLASQLNKQEVKQENAISIPFDEKLAQLFVKHLPFSLTDGQRISIWKIYQDIAKAQPMNRLIEGDVGSGKTVVAAMGAIMAISKNHQVALMAPTELLARQHATTLYTLLKPLGYDSTVTLLVGSMTTLQKKKARAAISSGKAGLIVGTQALIQDDIDMRSLALIIIDEQHRFGVEQRKTLMAKAGHMPHVLSLTATPIPRSLALTLYGELDITALKDKPAKRQPIITDIIFPGDKMKIYEEIERELSAGRQMFMVCPSIIDSDSLETISVETAYKELTEGFFKHRRIGLLHGKLKNEEKQSIMQKFLNKELDILVSTTVIEVGVDVPNATVMVVRSPERFGLAQLHQLRGRVGRGDHQGRCYLLIEKTDLPLSRLKALVSSNDGFKLAELDLELRGPGAIYGTAQHGALDLRIANLADVTLITKATSAAKAFISKKEDLSAYPILEKHIKKIMRVTNLN
ncbi:MAG TPA: ATP-dependent DNA helicase RecG [Candidatus Saccharimonadales bacterium]|nr:ATP-dependent DNA helicase RecG [Candidatus Saccharimonadales bacterium]